MGLLDKFLNRTSSKADLGYMSARQSAFNKQVSDLKNVTPEEISNVYGAVVDMHISENIATLICFADGTANLHYSNGHSTTGLGEKYGDIRNTVITFISNAEKVLPSMALTKSFELPQDSQTVVYLISRMGIYTISYDVNRPSSISSDSKYLNMLVQNVLTRIRTRLQKD